MAKELLPEMTVKEVIDAVKGSSRTIKVRVTGRIVDFKKGRQGSIDSANVTMSNLVTDKEKLIIHVFIWDDLLDLERLEVGKLLKVDSGLAYYQSKQGNINISCKAEFHTHVSVSQDRGSASGRRGGVLGHRTKATLSSKRCPNCGESMEDRLNIWYCPSCHYNTEQ